MIQIIKDSSNTIALTLNEAVTLGSPVFLFEFKNDQTLVCQYFIAEDVSSYPERYNKFIIEEKTSPDNLAGEVELEQTGFWKYRIFEQSSTTNLDPEECDNTTPLEIGKVKVIGEDTVKYNHDYNPTRTVYNG